VGLVARRIEEAGISTLVLSTIASFTASVGTPRVAAIEYPLGRAFGQPGDHVGQRQVLRACLEALELIDRPGAVVDLLFEWPEPPARARWHPPEPPPIAGLFRRKPWLFPRLVAGRIPER